MDLYVQGTLTILSLVNPVICGAMFSKIAAGKPSGARIAIATQAAVAIIAILCLAALAGAQLLHVFGISLSAFQVAGGIVLVWMGLIMLRGTASPTTANGSDSREASITPLVLFAASPGTITGVITLSIAHSQHGVPVTALVAIVVALTITWLVMITVARASGQKKPGLMHDISTRFMGLIVLAMGVQFGLTGVKQFLEL